MYDEDYNNFIIAIIINYNRLYVTLVVFTGPRTNFWTETRDTSGKLLFSDQTDKIR